MIEHLEIRPFTGRTYRLASDGDTNQATLAGMGIVDPAAMLAILRASRPDDPNRFLNGPFAPKPNYTPRKSRYTDGTLPVFYSALERNTTRAEMLHHNRLRLLGVTSVPGMSVFMREVECKFDGQVKDLRPEVQNISHLVSEEADGAYDTCNAIAAEARAEGLYGLLAPSARQPDGSCLPVFTRVALSDPVLGAWVTFTHDAAIDTVLCNEVA